MRWAVAGVLTLLGVLSTRDAWANLFTIAIRSEEAGYILLVPIVAAPHHKTSTWPREHGVFRFMQSILRKTPATIRRYSPQPLATRQIDTYLENGLRYST